MSTTLGRPPSFEHPPERRSLPAPYLQSGPGTNRGVVSAVGRTRRGNSLLRPWRADRVRRRYETARSGCHTGAVTPEPVEPDTKDWTWVLDRPCPECGFDPAAVHH